MKLSRLLNNDYFITYEESHFKTSTYSKKTLTYLGTLNPSVIPLQSQNQFIQPTHQSIHQTQVMDHQNLNTSHKSSTPKQSTLTASLHSQHNLSTLPTLTIGTDVHAQINLLYLFNLFFWSKYWFYNATLHMNFSHFGSGSTCDETNNFSSTNTLP